MGLHAQIRSIPSFCSALLRTPGQRGNPIVLNGWKNCPRVMLWLIAIKR